MHAQTSMRGAGEITSSAAFSHTTILKFNMILFIEFHAPISAKI